MTSSSLRSSGLLVLFLNQWNLLILLCKLTIDDKIQSSFPLFPIFFLVDIIILYACNCQIYLLPCSPVSYIHLHAQAPTSISNSIWNLTSCKINLYLFSCCCFPVAKSCLLFVTSWTAARQASLSFTISQSLLRLMSFELMMPFNHLILCHPLLLLPSIFPSIRVFAMGQLFTLGGQSIFFPLHDMAHAVFHHIICTLDIMHIMLKTVKFDCVLNHFSGAWLFATPRTVAHQIPLPMEFSRREYYSRLPCPPPEDL